MCSKSRSCVEVGSIIFAILNIAISGLLCLGSCALFIMAMKDIHDQGFYGNEGWVMIMTVISSVALPLSAIVFAFSIFLLIGLIGKRPAYVKAYFVYGVTVVLIGLVTAVGLMLVDGIDHMSFLKVGLSVLGLCCGYAAFLGMIWAAYKKILKEKQFKHMALMEHSHPPLIEGKN